MAGLLDEGPARSFSPAEQAALSYAEEATRRASGVGEATWKALREHWNDRQIVEITAVISLFNSFNRFNNALEVDPTVYPPPRAAAPSSPAPAPGA
jgi:alkylhydroperoxidase family enzyme